MSAILLAITVPGAPIAKKRPRFARRGKFVQTYNPQESEEGRWLWEAKQQFPPGWEPLRRPVKVSAQFFLPRPKSHYGTGKNAGKLKGSAPLLHTNKPDVDNLQKWVFDCLNGLAWEDDCCVVQVFASKEFSDRPRTTIFIEDAVA